MKPDYNTIARAILYDLDRLRDSTGIDRPSWLAVRLRHYFGETDSDVEKIKSPKIPRRIRPFQDGF